MRVGNKENYVNTGNAYKDMDGNMKQFTHVDHDKKTSISTSVHDSDVDLKNYYEENILEVLTLPAISLANDKFEYLIIRDREKGIIWNEKAVREKMMLDFYSNYIIRMRAWKGTVQEINWFDPICEDHEAMMRGDWKSLI